MTHRPEKVEQFIKEELSQILQREVRDPRIGFVSVTDVDIPLEPGALRGHFMGRVLCQAPVPSGLGTKSPIDCGCQGQRYSTHGIFHSL